MRTITFTQKAVTALLTAPLLFGLSSCSTDSQAQTSVPLSTDGVVIITNSRANVPVPTLSSGNQQLIRQALEQGLPIRIVSADGTPELVQIPQPKVQGKNEYARAASLDKALKLVSVAITALPNADEANAYGAFAVARDTASSLALKQPTLICISCGIDTAGPLTMTMDGAIRASATDYLDYLKATGQLVTFGESGFEKVQVILSSTGATADPQEPLSPADKQALTVIWRDVLQAGDAEVVIDPYPLSGESVQTEFPVTPVQIPEPPPMPTLPTRPVCEPQMISFDGASAARFVEDVAQWLDEGAARDALRPLAQWLIEGGGRTARIQGTTAGVNSGDPNEGKDLSLQRAAAARDMLIELGVSPDQILSVEGLGPDYPGRVPDRDEYGNPIPSERTKNRKVIITLLETC